MHLLICLRLFLYCVAVWNFLVLKTGGPLDSSPGSGLGRIVLCRFDWETSCSTDGETSCSAQGEDWVGLEGSWSMIGCGESLREVSWLWGSSLCTPGEKRWRSWRCWSTGERGRVSLCPAMVLSNSDGSQTFLRFPDCLMISGEGSRLVAAWNVGRGWGGVEWLEGGTELVTRLVSPTGGDVGGTWLGKLVEDTGLMAGLAGVGGERGEKWADGSPAETTGADWADWAALKAAALALSFCLLFADFLFPWPRPCWKWDWSGRPRQAWKFNTVFPSLQWRLREDSLPDLQTWRNSITEASTKEASELASTGMFIFRESESAFRS